MTPLAGRIATRLVLALGLVATLTLPVGSASTAAAGTDLLDGADPTPAALAAAADVCPLPYTPIYDIQGSGAETPLAVKTGVSTRGVVTGDFQLAGQLKGFFLQDPAGDGNDLTSDGIFVVSSAVDVAVGDVVRVTGTVAEYQGQTEFSPVSSVTKCGSTSPLAPTTVHLPEAHNGDLERYEGMLVSIPEQLTVDQNYFQGRYGQVTLSSSGRLYNHTNSLAPGSPEAILQADLNARRLLVLDDGSSAQNPNPIPYFAADHTLRAGDTVDGLVGLLDFGPINSNSSIRDYRLHPRAASDVAFTRANPRTAAPAPVGGNLKVASFNVLNYFNGDGAGGGFPTSRGATTLVEFNRQRAKTVAAIVAADPDVAGLMEIENDGSDELSAVQDLVNGLNAATAPGTYDLVAEPAPGSDAIKVAMLYKPGKVTPVGPGVNYQVSDPVYGDALFDRPPLAQTFRHNATGRTLTVVVNHFKSKSGCPTSGPDVDQGDGQGCWNAKRVRQAQELLGFVQSLQAASGDPNVLVIGDLNSYGKENPITTLTDGGLVDEIAQRIGATAYSYVFDGAAGYLDHALATASLDAHATGVTEWHINADEPSVIDYNTEFKPQDFYAPTPYRSSDHDPVVLGIELRLDVAIDVRPGEGRNPINLRVRGNVPVAILSGTYDGVAFDATTLDRSTVRFAGAPALAIGQSTEDVDGDGDLDVVLHFDTQALQLDSTAQAGCLAGATTTGLLIQGCDAISVLNR